MSNKVDKLKEIEQLYIKLRHIMEKNKNAPLNLLEENMKSYSQIFHNVFSATFTEVKEIINFVLNSVNDSLDKQNLSNSTITDKSISKKVSRWSVKDLVGTNNNSFSINDNAQQTNQSRVTHISNLNSFIHDDSLSMVGTNKKVQFASSASTGHLLTDYNTTPTLQAENKLSVINSQIEGLERSMVRKRSTSGEKEKSLSAKSRTTRTKTVEFR